MMLLKACPRCRGDLHINEDSYGSYKQCVQCGYLEDVEKHLRILAVTVGKPHKKAA